jgi:hypothetical protein
MIVEEKDVAALRAALRPSRGLEATSEPESALGSS